MSVLQTPSHCRAIPFCVLLLLLLDGFRIGQALCHVDIPPRPIATPGEWKLGPTALRKAR